MTMMATSSLWCPPTTTPQQSAGSGSINWRCWQHNIFGCFELLPYEMNVITSRCKNEIHAFFLLLNFRVLRQILLSLPPILDMLFLLFFIMVIFAMLGKKWGKIVIEKSVVSFYVVHYKKKIYKKVLVTNWNSISVITPSIPKLNDFWRIVIL